jgi:hypothetical protein
MWPGGRNPTATHLTGVNQLPAPLRSGPASSSFVTAVSCNETVRQGNDARLATLTTLAQAGQASWCGGADWIPGGAW